MARRATDPRIHTLTYLTAQEVLNRRFDAQALTRYASRLSVHDCVSTIGKMIGVLADDPLEADEAAFSFLRMSEQRRIRDIWPGRPLLFRERLLAALRTSIMDGPRRPASGLADGPSRGSLMGIILGVTDVYDPDAIAFDPADAPGFLRRAALQQLVKSSRPPAAQQVARMRRLFVRLTEERSDAQFIRDTFEGQVGLPLDRFLAICFGITIRTMTAGRDPRRWPISYGYFEPTNITRGEFDLTVDLLAATPDEFQDLFRIEIEAGRDRIWDLEPFARVPLCRRDGGTVLPVDPSNLLETLLGDGVYWRLRHIVGRVDGDGKFCETVGKLLQEHLEHVAAATLQGTNVAVFGARGFTDRDGNKKEGPDLGLWSDSQLALVEIGATRCRYRETVLRGDVAEFKNDIEKVLTGQTGKLTQLDKRITELRSGELSYPGVPADAPIWPVLALFDGFPTGPLLSGDIADAIRAAGLFAQPNVHQPSILNASEAETLLAIAREGDVPIHEALHGWHEDGVHRPFLAYWQDLIDGPAPQPAVVMDEYDETIDGWTNELGMDQLGTD